VNTPLYKEEVFARPSFMVNVVTEATAGGSTAHAPVSLNRLNGMSLKLTLVTSLSQPLLVPHSP
jgi:hypothetical protein